MHNKHDNDTDGVALDVVAAAEYLGRAPSTLATWRTFRRGPVYRKAPNGRVTYQRADLDAWLAEHPHQAA